MHFYRVFHIFVQCKGVVHRIFEDFVGKTCAFQNYENSVSYGVIHDIKLGAKSFDSNISIFILERRFFFE